MNAGSKWIGVAIVFMLCASAGWGAEDVLTLVKKGKVQVAVIFQKGCPAKTKKKRWYDPPTPYEWFNRRVLNGARDVAHYLGKMSGAKIPLLAEDEPVPAGIVARIYVGHTDAAAKAGVTFPSGFNPTVRKDIFDEEGYVVKRKGSNIYIGGNQDGDYLGTMYGCAAFLRYLGCRFYFPGEWGEVIPRKKTITVTSLYLRSKPDFAVRDIGYSGWVPATGKEKEEFKLFCMRNGLNPGHRFYPPANDGSMGVLLPIKKYAKDHPEYYAMRRDGTRPKNGSGMYCLSNPEVLSESIKNLKAYWARGRKGNNYLYKSYGIGLSPRDGAPFCFCKNCQKMNANFNYPTYVRLPMISEMYYGFIAKLAKAFPDKIINTAAYSLRETPPQGVVLPDNVAIQYAPISCDVLHPCNDPRSWRRQEMWSMLKQFRRQTPHVYVSDYNPGLLLGAFVPERATENYAVNIPMYKKLDIKGNLVEGRKAVMQTWLSYYVLGHLLWNSKTDVNKLQDEFYANFFGKAGPLVRAWWEDIAATLVKSRIQTHEDWLLTHIYTVPYVQSLHKYVDAARKAATREPYKGRVEAFALIADHLEAFAAMNEAEKNLDYPKAIAAAKRTMEDKRKLHVIYSHFIDVKMAYMHGFTTQGRLEDFPKLLAKMDGTKGNLVAKLPLETAFTRDPFNSGVLMEWYAPGFDDSAWGTHNTYYFWEQQEKPLDKAGHNYDGYGWYRFKVKVPAAFADKPMRLLINSVINEAWVWVNGHYVGHRPHRIWWMSPHEAFETNVTKAIKPGKENIIAVRILNDAGIGGLFRRGFLYSPK